MPRKLAIVMFDDVEVLDFAGPYEVFAVARDIQTNEPLFDVYLVAEDLRPITARNRLSINPHYTFFTAPEPDIVLVPGGDGRRRQMYNPALLEWVAGRGQAAEHVLSVCTGAFILAGAGLLHGLAATTYHRSFEELAAFAPDVQFRPGQRWVDNGKVITSAGVSAGIDMALHVIEVLHGPDQALHTARYMEYEYYPRHAAD